jgi:hypothetical protein
MTQITPQPENLAQLVFLVRGEKVLLDADLAMLYGVETGALNRAVKRNIERFPADFMLQLSLDEWEDLKCQVGISSSPASAAKTKKPGTIRSQIVTTSLHGGLAPFLTPLPNKASPCYPAFCAPNVRLRSTSPSCARLCSYAA